MLACTSLLKKGWGFFQRNPLIDWSSRFGLILQLLNLGLTATSYLFLSHLVGREALVQSEPTAAGAFPFALFGTATNAAMLRGLNGLARSLQLHQPAGVLKPLLLGQTPPLVIPLLSSVYSLIRAWLDLTLYLLVDRGIGRLV
jgi:hypothetical protein